MCEKALLCKECVNIHYKENINKISDVNNEKQMQIWIWAEHVAKNLRGCKCQLIFRAKRWFATNNILSSVKGIKEIHL